ncbi:hypothetical protein ACFQZZ_15305 [Nocardia sp. GCM10030253]|uniref:hypothetical protein n=1 Tax=Nocardia sp. GCM10030253 TaxID=3273404 RepID=UPI0036348B33
MDGEWIIAFSRADRELLDMMKEAVPQSGRRWDVENQLWQIAALEIVCLAGGTRVGRFGALAIRRSLRRSDDHQQLVEPQSTKHNPHRSPALSFGRNLRSGKAPR